MGTAHSSYGDCISPLCHIVVMPNCGQGLTLGMRYNERWSRELEQEGEVCSHLQATRWDNTAALLPWSSCGEMGMELEKSHFPSKCNMLTEHLGTASGTGNCGHQPFYLKAGSSFCILHVQNSVASGGLSRGELTTYQLYQLQEDDCPGVLCNPSCSTTKQPNAQERDLSTCQLDLLDGHTNLSAVYSKHLCVHFFLKTLLLSLPSFGVAP